MIRFLHRARRLEFPQKNGSQWGVVVDGTYFAASRDVIQALFDMALNVAADEGSALIWRKSHNRVVDECGRMCPYVRRDANGSPARLTLKASEIRIDREAMRHFAFTKHRRLAAELFARRSLRRRVQTSALVTVGLAFIGLLADLLGIFDHAAKAVPQDPAGIAVHGENGGAESESAGPLSRSRSPRDEALDRTMRGQSPLITAAPREQYLANIRERDGVIAPGMPIFTAGNSWVSAIPNQAAIACAAQNGVTLIISLCPEYEVSWDEREAFRQIGADVVHVDVDPDAGIASVISRTRQLLLKYPREHVWIYSTNGQLAGAAWLAHRIVDDGCSRDIALREARSIGLTSPELIRSAQDYVDALDACEEMPTTISLENVEG